MRIIDERRTIYGNACGKTSRIVGDELVSGSLDTLSQYGLLFNWIMILNKLMRAAVSPQIVDHWADIIGYAQLAIDEINERPGDND